MSPADADLEAQAPAGTPPPTLTVVKGDPTPEELAALVAVLVAATSRPNPA